MIDKKLNIKARKIVHQYKYLCKCSYAALVPNIHDVFGFIFIIFD